MEHRPWSPAGASADAGFDEGPIQVRVATVEQLFNAIDPTPLPERSLNPEVADWIEEWAEDLDGHEALTVEVIVADELDRGLDPDLERAVATSIRAHFRYREWQVGRQLHRLLRDGRVSLVIGVVALAGFTSASRLIGESPNAAIDVVHEGLLVLGWVSMWRPLEILLYAWWPVRRERTACRRLARSTVVFPSARAATDSAAVPAPIRPDR